MKRPQAASLLRLLVFALACLAIGAWAGRLIERRQETPRMLDPIRAYAGRQWVDVSTRRPIACPPNPQTILILGQSNAAHSAGERFASALGAVDWLDGRCYAARGPTLGSEGAGGSVWPLVGDHLLAADPTRPVQFIGLAMNGSSSREWGDRRLLGGLLARRLASLKAQGVTVDKVAWHQGESDPDTPVSIYQQRLRSVIEQVASVFPAATFYIAQASVCAGRPPRSELLASQASLVDGRRILSGPDTDHLLASEDRFDDCHFSASGARKVAWAWAQSLRATPP